MFTHRPCCPCVGSEGLLQPSAPRSPPVVLAKFPTLFKELMTPCTTAAASTPKPPLSLFSRGLYPFFHLYHCRVVHQGVWHVWHFLSELVPTVQSCKTTHMTIRALTHSTLQPLVGLWRAD